MGRIAQNLTHEDIPTPLQQRLGKLSAKIATISGIIAAILCAYMIIKLNIKGQINIDTSGILDFLQSIEPAKDVYLVCIALIVATVPEGLPTMVNITLAITMQKMAKINALVTKKEPAKDVYLVCIALIVATVPEGLPTMVNITLAITMQKMAKINALVTKKETCETIGCVSVICSDKTGTLTQNKMKVDVAYVDGKYVDSSKYVSNSYFEENCLINSTSDIEKEGDSYKYIGSATECALLLYHNDKNYNQFRKNTNLLSQIPFNSEKKRMSSLIIKDEDIVFLTKGAPEVLLKKCMYMQKGRDIVSITPQIRRNILNEIRKLQVKSMRFLTKGAPEVLLKKCMYMQKGRDIVSITPQIRRNILNEIRKLQVKSMRVLGFAYKVVDKSLLEVAITSNKELDVNRDIRSYENNEDLVFGGFVGILDPLRDGVKESIQTAFDAGVDVKMLTGDNINTAMSIGKEIGLLDGGKKAVEATYIDILSETAFDAGVDVKMLTGDNINTAMSIGKEIGLLDGGKKAVEATYIDILSETELRDEIKEISIVARSKPDTKMRIVQALQANGEVVAVTQIQK